MIDMSACSHLYAQQTVCKTIQCHLWKCISTNCNIITRIDTDVAALSTESLRMQPIREHPSRNNGVALDKCSEWKKKWPLEHVSQFTKVIVFCVRVCVSVIYFVMSSVIYNWYFVRNLFLYILYSASSLNGPLYKYLIANKQKTIQGSTKVWPVHAGTLSPTINGFLYMIQRWHHFGVSKLSWVHIVQRRWVYTVHHTWVP